jgi:phospholipid/cholesterol/gamma-HCH transport system substrate-binding protein
MKKSRNEMMVGLFVIVGFIMLALVVFFISGVYVFRHGYTVNVMYDYVDILDKGAPVRMAGVRIGEVSLVTLLKDKKIDKTRVQVKLFIEEGVQIQENYIFEVRGTHILSEPHIEVTPIAGDAPILQEGATLEGPKLYPMEDLIKRAQSITVGLDEAINGDLDDAQGDLKETIRQLKESTDSLNKIMTHFSSGEGTAGKLLMDDALYQEMDSFVKDIKRHPWKLLKKDDGGKRKRKWYFLFLF